MNIIDRVGILGDFFMVQGKIHIQIPNKALRLAKSMEVMVEFWRNLGGGPDQLKGSAYTDANGVYAIIASSLTDENYLPCGTGYNYYVRATHVDSQAKVRQDFVLMCDSATFWAASVHALRLEEAGNPMPSNYS